MARGSRKTVLQWIQDDYTSHPVRFVIEALGMIFNLSAALLMAFMSPTPNMFWVYILFLTATSFLILAAVHRKSTGFLVMYVGYLLIDGFGFIKTLF